MEISAELGNFCKFLYCEEGVGGGGASVVSTMARKVDSISYKVIKKQASHGRRIDIDVY